MVTGLCRKQLAFTLNITKIRAILHILCCSITKKNELQFFDGFLRSVVKVVLVDKCTSRFCED